VGVGVDVGTTVGVGVADAGTATGGVVDVSVAGPGSEGAVRHAFAAAATSPITTTAMMPIVR